MAIQQQEFLCLFGWIKEIGATEKDKEVSITLENKIIIIEKD